MTPQRHPTLLHRCPALPLVLLLLLPILMLLLLLLLLLRLLLDLHFPTPLFFTSNIRAVF
jgi:hypothetical protein